MENHLASMENITCWAFRKLCRNVSDSYTGIMSLTNLIKRNNVWEEIDTYPIEGQRQWIQIATSKESDCVKFFQRLEEELKKHPEKDNIYGIQLNCSCPSSNLISIGQGPALIKRTTKVISLLKELLKQNKYKIGIKLRLGLNEDEVKQRKIFNLLRELEILAQENKNLTNVTIHFKHAKEKSSSTYDYSLLNEIASFKLPIVINGGIKMIKNSHYLLKNVSEEHKKHIGGIMIGREALKNPDCFSEKPRVIKEIKIEFESLCKQHKPKPIYLETIESKCDWNK